MFSDFFLNSRLTSLKKLLIFFGATLLYCIIFVFFYNILKFNKVFTEASIGAEIVSFIYNFIPTAIIVLLNYLVIFKIDRWSKDWKFLGLKIGIDILISFSILFVVNHLFLIIGSNFKPSIKVNWVGTMLNNILVFLILETVYYVIDSHNSLKQIERERQRLLQYQYDALKSQINPHFLFNSLNILYSLISIDTKKSKEFVLALSGMYRYIMNQQHEHTIKLKDEFDFLDSYIAILKMRYHNQFNVNINNRNLINGDKIIPYTLQILIENVTKHNVVSTKYPMVVDINIGETYLKVENKIQFRVSELSNGIGLNYISEQYKIFGKNIEIENNGLNFIVKIPYI